MNPYIDGDGNKFWLDRICTLYREDGPAVECADGSKYWYYHGEEIVCDCQEEFDRIIKLRMFW